MKWVIKFPRFETPKYYVSPQDEPSEDIDNAYLWNSSKMANAVAEGYETEYVISAVHVVEES